jgi:protein-disulfide isomerase
VTIVKSFLVLIPVITSLSACSVEFKTAGMGNNAPAFKTVELTDNIAQDCMGDKGWCVVSDHDKIDHLKPSISDEQIHAALRAHPDWIREAVMADPQLIADAQTALMQRQMLARQVQARKMLADNHDAVFADPADPVLGNPMGDVTIVEFFDSDCPFCRKLAPVLDQLLATDPGVRLVLKDFPILGPGSDLASRYALAALRQGKYAPFHAALMASTLPEHQLDETAIQSFAAAAGLDVARAKADAAAPEMAARLALNRTLAQKLAISGTPGLIIGDQIQGGVMSFDALKMAVAEARTKKTAMTP